MKLLAIAALLASAAVAQPAETKTFQSRDVTITVTSANFLPEEWGPISHVYACGATPRLSLTILVFTNEEPPLEVALPPLSDTCFSTIIPVSAGSIFYVTVQIVYPSRHRKAL